MRQLLAETVEALSTDVTAPAIIITGAGGAFCSGGDLDALRALLDAGDAHGFRELLEQGARAVLAIARAPQPVIAAIDGAATGAGMNLALACDVRVASSFAESEAVFSQPFVGIGLAPDWGGSYHLPRLAGTGAAADLVFSADRISADTAKELRLVDVVVPDGPALPAALARAQRYSERPAAALAAAKRVLNAERLPRLAEALARETEIQLELFTSGVLAANLPRAARQNQERPS
jgi:2-(1,2-epoxy-1,2-dihydrophenyl)acetyl-CoA isomerase